jgi:ATP-grasp domain
VRVLLSDGSGLTSRQVATLLAASGHHVEALAPGGLTLTRTTRWVRKVHTVPPYGLDPFGWLDAALSVLRRDRFDVLLPTQEQVVVLALEAAPVRETGAALAVPQFASLLRVQDKLAAFRTLTELGVPQPATIVAVGPGELRAIKPVLPAFVKTPIGTASSGVRRVTTPTELARLAADLERDDAFADGGVLIQQPAPGPLAMVQSVFSDGRLAAFHACWRTREGANGGASGKESVDLPEVRDHFTRLGEALAWHGALSADVVVTDAGPCFIDVNPRLVEPGNGARAGVDLVGTMLRISVGTPESGPTMGRPGVRTHQLLLALFRAAQTAGRRGVAAEIAAAARRAGPYEGSAEELTPLRGDPLTAVPLLYAACSTLIRPASWTRLASGAVSGYALTPDAWRQIRRRADEG